MQTKINIILILIKIAAGNDNVCKGDIAILIIFLMYVTLILKNQQLQHLSFLFCRA